MRTITILLVSILSFTLNAQHMERSKVNETVSKLFVATDNKNWSKVEHIFAELVELDYSSMNGNPIAKMTFNYKYQDGNTDLPQKAINKLKK